jgi:hypothetical protein
MRVKDLEITKKKKCGEREEKKERERDGNI